MLNKTTYGPYTPVRQAGDHYFVSGQVGIAPSTNTASQSIEEQTHQTLKNIQALLQQNNLSMADVVKTNIYLQDMDDFELVNNIYIEYFPEPRPARACVEIAGLPKIGNNKLLIEIEAVAYKPAGK